MTEYQFDFSKNFTISDYAAYTHYQKSTDDIETLMQFYEVVDKFFVGDLFALDMKDVSQVVIQFSARLVIHLEARK